MKGIRQTQENEPHQIQNIAHPEQQHKILHSMCEKYHIQKVLCD